MSFRRTFAAAPTHASTSSPPPLLPHAAPRRAGAPAGQAVSAGRRGATNPHRRALVAALLTAPLARRAWATSAASTAALAPTTPAASPAASLPILVYHRFATTVADSMTLRLSTFDAHLRLLDSLGCQVVALSDWVAWRRGEGPALPARAVALSADDGHRSQAEQMAPRLRERGWPLTLFVYPSAISNASYAMTWDQLGALAALPRLSVQSHTTWHPNLLRERERQPAAAFRRFADAQLHHSRALLEQRLGHPVTLLAWPFGLSDPGLQAQARDCDYLAAFALGNRSATALDPLYAVPRHLMVDAVDAHALAARLEQAFAGRGAR